MRVGSIKCKNWLQWPIKVYRVDGSDVLCFSKKKKIRGFIKSFTHHFFIIYKIDSFPFPLIFEKLSTVDLLKWIDPINHHV